MCLCGCFQRGVSKQEMVTFKVGDFSQCLVKIELQGKCVLCLPPLLPKHLYLCALCSSAIQHLWPSKLGCISVVLLETFSRRLELLRLLASKIKQLLALQTLCSTGSYY